MPFNWHPKYRHQLLRSYWIFAHRKPYIGIWIIETFSWIIILFEFELFNMNLINEEINNCSIFWQIFSTIDFDFFGTSPNTQNAWLHSANRIQTRNAYTYNIFGKKKMRTAIFHYFDSHFVIKRPFNRLCYFQEVENVLRCIFDRFWWVHRHTHFLDIEFQQNIGKIYAFRS